MLNGRAGRLRALASVTLCCSLSAAKLQAQTITATINGLVTDQSGAVLPNATVVAKNVATGVQTRATANQAGQYSMPFLQIGQYTVTVTSGGFQTFVSPVFTLEVNQVAKVDAPLKVGSGTETVTVSSEVQPILDTEDATLATTFTANTVQNLPLNGRNFSSVTEFLPGSVSTQPTGFANQNGIERDTNADGQTSVNGNRSQSNNYLLDGVEINETINNVIGYNPSPDAIENLTVISSNAPAEYGNVNGGDVITVLKSGTNHIHGSAFGFLENYSLNANSWANNFSNTPKQPFTETIFGGTLGGPIKRDKLFFFVDYEAARYQTGGTQTVSVIPTAFRTGDFSSLLGIKTATHPNGYQLTHFVAGVGQVPYANNQVPVTNPAAIYLFAHPELYPLPNQGVTSGPNNGQNNYRGSFKSTERNDQGDVKIDYRLGNRDSLFGRYSQGDASDANPRVPVLITFPSTNDYPFKGFAFNEVHTLSPSIINEFRAGWSRVRWNQGVPSDPTGVFGLQGNSLLGINFQQPLPGFTLQDFGANGGGFSQTYLTGVGTTGGGSTLIDNTFTYGDNITFQLQKHTIRAGVLILRYQQNIQYRGNDGIEGREQYNGDFTGSTVSDFDTGQVHFAGVSGNSGLSGQRQYRDAGFVQDAWKASDKATINFGLRYEYDQPIYEAHDHEANVDLLTGQYIYAGTAQAAQAYYDGHALYNPVYTNFQPRLGFAYQASPRFVVRGGYGTTNYFEGTGANLRLNFNPPFQPSFVYTAVAATTTSPGTPLTTQNALPANFTTAASSNTLRAWQGKIKPALVQEFSFGGEYEVNNKTSATIAYVGQTGNHLVDARAANQLTLAQAVDLTARGLQNTSPSIPAADAAPYANLVGQTGSIVETESESVSNYNSAQLTVRHRQSDGLEYQVNYTYSKALTNNPGFFGSNGIKGASAYWQDAYNGGADYGPAGNDTRHNLSAFAVYQLPFGRGRKYGAHLNRLVDEAAGGWKITGTAIAYAGFPVTINAPNTTAANNRASRANHYRPLRLQDRTLGNWFGTDPSSISCGPGVDNGVCAYGTPNVNQFGTARVGSERAPGFEQIDISGGKQFDIVEGQNLEFRADVFNTFNIASYYNPDNNITDSNFGQISSTRSAPRTIQFSLHYNF